MYYKYSIASQNQKINCFFYGFMDFFTVIPKTDRNAPLAPLLSPYGVV